MIVAIVAILLGIIVFCFFIIVRNGFVLKERLLINDAIFAQHDYMHYLRIKDQVVYDYMMWRFWVWPVSKLWPQELQDLRKEYLDHDPR